MYPSSLVNVCQEEETLALAIVCSRREAFCTTSTLGCNPNSLMISTINNNNSQSTKQPNKPTSPQSSRCSIIASFVDSYIQDQ